ncbi:MAG: hypothetical protein V3R54_03700 [Thermodesulfovibrionia bacterium]
MKFWIGVTNNEWFKFLSTRTPDEVNFWQPGGTSFRALEPGEPFLFKLHSPLNFIVGGGYFVRHSVLPTNDLFLPGREYIEWHNEEIYRA